MELINDEQSIRRSITDLRLQLDDINISDRQVDQVKDMIQRLKNRVTIIKIESDELRIQNEVLKSDNEDLSKQAERKKSEVETLKEDNNDLKYISWGIDSVSIVILNEDGYEKDSSKFFHTHLEERKDMILSLFEDVLFEFSSKDPYAKSMANAKASIILINMVGYLIKREEEQIKPP